MLKCTVGIFNISCRVDQGIVELEYIVKNSTVKVKIMYDITQQNLLSTTCNYIEFFLNKRKKIWQQ